MLFSLYKRMHGAQRRRPNYTGIATGSGSPPGSGCYRCGSPPSSTGSPGLPGTQFDEAWSPMETSPQTFPNLKSSHWIRRATFEICQGPKLFSAENLFNIAGVLILKGQWSGVLSKRGTSYANHANRAHAIWAQIASSPLQTWGVIFILNLWQ